MAEWREFGEGPSDGTGVRGFLHEPMAAVKAGVVLTHGAGASCESPLLIQLSIALAETGFTVLRCDLPFRQLRPKGPPRGSSVTDQHGLRAAVAAMRHLVTGHVFLGGHSYGGRQATMLSASEHEVADGLLLLSYPLHPPEKPAQVRTAHFPDLRVPSLFVHGSRDGFGSLDEMQEALRLIPGRTELLPIQGGAHGLITARTAAAVCGMIAARFSAFAGQ